jgi:uncharacterized protein
MSNNRNFYDEAHVLHALKHHLPTQTPLKDFIHHNTLHGFQDMKFFEAIFKASKIFGYQVTYSVHEYRKLFAIGRIRREILEMVITKQKGASTLSYWLERVMHKHYESERDFRIGQLRANWKSCYHFDIENATQPLLFRIVNSYLDQGIAIWHFPFDSQGFLASIQKIDGNGFSSFFKTARARQLLHDEGISIEKLLDILVGDAAYYEQYLFDQAFSHRGWSGMAATLEDNPQSLMYEKKISLKDFIMLDLLLEIDALDDVLGENNWQPLATKITSPPLDLFAAVQHTEWHEVLQIWQQAFEWSYYDEVLTGVKKWNEQKGNRNINKAFANNTKTFQAIFCIDERECSLRRHLEYVDSQCETLGSPGFFGVEFFLKPAGAKFYEKLCPAPVTPKYLVKEVTTISKQSHEVLYTKHSHRFFRGFLSNLVLGGWAAIKLGLDLFRPKMSAATSDAFFKMHKNVALVIENKDPNDIENGLQVGFTIEEMADRVENLLMNLGLRTDFAPLVYLISHGSSSANNHFYGAYDCGACSGRPGASNARVFSFMANHQEVRQILRERGLDIPETTQFLGAMHNTTSDEIMFYDEDKLSDSNRQLHLVNHSIFDQSLELNAKERSRRFSSIDTKAEIKKIRDQVYKRKVSIFEPRPEFGHGSNALCFVGHRNLTKGLFLDRRAFMNSYDYRTDPTGERLLGVMRPLPPVCGGINLEYYFSRIDNYKLGAGTKLPHNVMGLIGVANSVDGDLRTGLPIQTVEIHDPVRLLIVVEHFPDVVLHTIQTEASLYEWFINEWVHLVAIHPETNAFYYFNEGKFELYTTILQDIPRAEDIHELIEKAEEMESNHIIHATLENIPVHILD